MKKLFTALLSCLLVFASCFSVPAVLAETADNMITAMHLAEWNADGGVEHKVNLEQGKIYTFTALWKHVEGDTARVKLFGNAVGESDKNLVIAKAAQENVTYDLSTGRLSYTFTALGDTLTIQAFMGERVNGTRRDIYFAKPELFESDENGNKIENGAVIDCDAQFETSWSQWSGYPNYRSVEPVSADFFEEKLTAQHLETWYQNGTFKLNVPGGVEDGKTYVFNVLYKLSSGSEARFQFNYKNWENSGWIDLLVGREAKTDGVTYDQATGKLSYKFTATTNPSQWWAFRFYTGDAPLKHQNFYIAQPELYEVDENGEKIPDSDKDCALSNWEKWTYESAVVNETVTVPLDFFENKRGDVDGNGKIEATDLAMLRKILLGVEACQNEYTANANGDSDIDLRDLICLKKNLLG